MLLLDGRGNIYKSTESLPIEIRLLSDDKAEVKNGFEIVRPSSLKIEKSGSLRVSVKVNILSSDAGNKKFLFEVRPLPTKAVSVIVHWEWVERLTKGSV